MRRLVLWSALFARERGAHPRLSVLVVVGVAAGMGAAAARMAAAGVVPTNAPGGEFGPVGWLLEFDKAAVTILLLAGAFRLLVRPGEDHTSGWLTGYIASGGSREAYLVSLWGAVVAVMTIAALIVAPVFGVAWWLAGGGSAPLARLPQVLMVAPLAIGAACVAAAAIGAVTRDTAAAVAIVVLLIVVPAGIAIPLYLRSALPEWAGTLLSLHLPPRPDGRLGFVLQNVAYIVIVGGLLASFADRLVARRA
jgi:hypothetical protein